MRINPKLLESLESRLKVNRRQIYYLIEQKVRETHLPRNLAAIALATEHRINISRYASEDDLAIIRQGAPLAPPVKTVSLPNEKKTTQREAKKPKRVAARGRRRGTSVFVVHGRDEQLRRSLFSFLRSIGLEPIEWQKAISLTDKPSPYVGEILDTAFREAVAVVVLLSPEDEAKLNSSFIKPSDPPYEKSLMGQPRPNVLFEAGMAFGKNPDSTVLVQVGEVKPFSDLAGRHVVRLRNSAESRKELITKLANAGCNVDTSGSDWLTEGDFGS